MKQRDESQRTMTPVSRSETTKRLSRWIGIGMIGFAMTAFTGCDARAERQSCASGDCRADAAITADVYAAFSQHANVNFANSVTVQTRDGVVYLYGRSWNTPLAESLASQTPGVKRVVNSIVPEEAGAGG